MSCLEGVQGVSGEKVCRKRNVFKTVSKNVKYILELSLITDFCYDKSTAWTIFGDINVTSMHH